MAYLMTLPILLFPAARAAALPTDADSIDPHGPSLSSVRPEPMESPLIELEGHELIPLEMGRSDAEVSTILWVPSLKAAIAGDIAYNDVHVNVAATDLAGRQAWIDALHRIAGLGPITVVAGHKRPAAADEPRIVGETISYLEDFDRCLSAGSSAGELIGSMLRLHRGRMISLHCGTPRIFSSPVSARARTDRTQARAATLCERWTAGVPGHLYAPRPPNRKAAPFGSTRYPSRRGRPWRRVPGLRNDHAL